MRKRTIVVVVLGCFAAIIAAQALYSHRQRQVQSADLEAAKAAGATIHEYQTDDSELSMLGLNYSRRYVGIVDLDPDRLDSGTYQRLQSSGAQLSLDLSDRDVSNSSEKIPAYPSGLRMERSRNVDVVLSQPSFDPGFCYSLLLADSDLTSNGAAGLSRFLQLLRLDVSGTAFSDADLASLPTSSSLNSLDFAGVNLTDAGLQQLAKSIVLSGRNGINDLVLDDTKVTAEGLNAFYDKVHASRLSVAGLSLSDEDLAQLAPKLNCGVLCLGDNPVTGQGLKHLWTYGRFYALHLNGCPLTNADLETLLSERPPDALTLNTLNLAGTQVDDAGVETLTKLRILALLILSPNQISEEGLSRLRQRWPELRIQFQLNPKQKLLYLDGTQRTPSVTPTST